MLTTLRVRSVLCWVLFLLFSLALACGASSTPATLQAQLSATTLSASGVPVTLTSAIPTGATTHVFTNPGIKPLLDQVQSDRLMVVVGSLADMGSRHVLSKPAGAVRGIDAARDWLVSQFTEIKYAHPAQPISVWTQPVRFSWHGINLAPENVVAVFQGTDVGAGVIVIGAHYDSISHDAYNGQAYAPGANDNGSGVAAMLEIARILAPQSHRATILFVAFAAEETGRQGSLAFAKDYLQAQDPPIAVRGMINLDLVGSEIGPNGEDDPHTIRLFSAEPNDSPSRQLARQIAFFANTYLDDVNIVLQSAEDRAGRWGDQMSFSAAGYPAVRLIQALEDVTRQHSPLDTIDNVQAGYLMRTTRVALVSTMILADGPTPPGNLVLRAAIGNPNVQNLAWTAVPDAAHYLIALRQETSLPYDQVFTIDASPSPELGWSGFTRYATVAVASVDASGLVGPLSPELSIFDALNK